MPSAVAEAWEALELREGDDKDGPRALALAPLHTLRVHLGRLAADEALGDVGWVKRSMFQAMEQLEQQIERLGR